MEIKDMKMEDIEVRSAEIAEELQKEDADIDALTAEVEELEARKAQILKEVEERKALLDEVEKTGIEIEEKPQEERKVENIEMRNTKEYALAFAKYIRSEDDKECRALLTENGSGTVAVPEFVYDEIKTMERRRHHVQSS